MSDTNNVSRNSFLNTPSCYYDSTRRHSFESYSSFTKSKADKKHYSSTKDIDSLLLIPDEQSSPIFQPDIVDNMCGDVDDLISLADNKCARQSQPNVSRYRVSLEDLTYSTEINEVATDIETILGYAESRDVVNSILSVDIDTLLQQEDEILQNSKPGEFTEMGHVDQYRPLIRSNSDIDQMMEIGENLYNSNSYEDTFHSFFEDYSINDIDSLLQANRDGSEGNFSRYRGSVSTLYMKDQGMEYLSRNNLPSQTPQDIDDLLRLAIEEIERGIISDNDIRTEKLDIDSIIALAVQ
ncbi:hypothetical protein ROZALSC1DRAFT_27227 [Rozella allomycis CSF55]|uniref:Laminin IV type B domain-containing protein n=1 Tax=Rozella allomycis (strain CSF55) TaxID=988480 RepID=A0A4P9YRM1_ROZAC|nr:hypothetical protein ROZALSC1DRAFT_27227 [Rozella allomycis CSF55]